MGHILHVQGVWSFLFKMLLLTVTAMPDSSSPSANPLWGGRFAAAAAPLLQQINASINVDKRLYHEDIDASRAHAAMLAEQGIISRDDNNAIQQGLETIRGEITAGKMAFTPDLEDIHMHIEVRLKQLIGDAAGRLHTGRSRNDQVVTDFRLWLRRTITEVQNDITSLAQALLLAAAPHVETILPGYTHLQPAQPVTFAHHLLAYEAMLRRDYGRLSDCAVRLNECPLGAAALAGTTYPLNRASVAKALGFDRPTANSLDSVSSRDFALEFLAAAAILGTHLSRLAEELVLWTSPAFGFVRLSDAYTTGSSIMPNKKNPDAAELVRAKTPGLLAAFSHLAGILKGLPLAYSKDLQDDKKIVFEAVDTLHLSLRVMAGMIADMTVNVAAMRTACGKGHLLATEVADWCVQTMNMPFRDAHHLAASLVNKAEALGLDLADLSLDVLHTVDPRLNEHLKSVLTLEAAVARRAVPGGTAPIRVREALAQATQWWDQTTPLFS